MDLGCNKKLLAIDLDDCNVISGEFPYVTRIPPLLMCSNQFKEVYRKPTGFQFDYTTRKVDG